MAFNQGQLEPRSENPLGLLPGRPGFQQSYMKTSSHLKIYQVIIQTRLQDKTIRLLIKREKRELLSHTVSREGASSRKETSMTALEELKAPAAEMSPKSPKSSRRRTFALRT